MTLAARAGLAVPWNRLFLVCMGSGVKRDSVVHAPFAGCAVRLERQAQHPGAPRAPLLLPGSLLHPHTHGGPLLLLSAEHVCFGTSTERLRMPLGVSQPCKLLTAGRDPEALHCLHRRRPAASWRRSTPRTARSPLTLCATPPRARAGGLPLQACSAACTAGRGHMFP